MRKIVYARNIPLGANMLKPRELTRPINVLLPESLFNTLDNFKVQGLNRTRIVIAALELGVAELQKQKSLSGVNT